ANASGARAGSVYVIDPDSLSSAGAPADIADVCSVTIEGRSEGDALRGIAVLPALGKAGPLLAVGAYHADGPSEKDIDSGKVYLIDAGSLSGPRISLADSDFPVIVGPNPRSLLGRSLATGDVDGDGLDDLALSAYASRGDGSKADASGEVFLLYGVETAPSEDLNLADDSLPRFRSASRWDLFGLPLALCDLNGDGRSELIVAAQFADFEDKERRRCGRVYVFWGGPRSVIDVKTGKAELADVTVTGPEAFGAIGGALETASISGRYPDLLIGAPDAGASPGREASGMVALVPSSLLSAR
ncbi:MAG: hypothetical protein GF400_00650, partial [Candidatus Eisenbacteria bacterium]|nr:hypothetical protein [Candidatus Eisenbacteria bacterium]